MGILESHQKWGQWEALLVFHSSKHGDVILDLETSYGNGQEKKDHEVKRRGKIKINKSISEGEGLWKPPKVNLPSD